LNVMHEDILTINQKNLAESVLPRFASSFTLCGGTAIALQLGHRGSIDFDLLSFIEINAHGIIRRLNSVNAVIEHTIVSSIDELTVVVNSVKLTFFTFPFRIPAVVTWPMASIAMPTLLDLASMKAYALGRRGKWKDYVDLYFLFQGHVSMPQLVENCRKIFQGAFNERLFREQLCFFDDVDMTEQVSYLEKGPSDRNIQNFLTNLATSS
jgi:hypothetical protein